MNKWKVATIIMLVILVGALLLLFYTYSGNKAYNQGYNNGIWKA